MNRCASLLTLFTSASLCAAAIAQDDLPQWPGRATPEFVRDPQPMEFKIADAGRLALDLPDGFAATFVLAGNESAVGHAAPLGREWNDDVDLTNRLLETQAAKTFSPAQRELVRTIHWLKKQKEQDSQRRLPHETTEFTLYAVSEDDARAMAEAGLELCDRLPRQRFESERRRLAEMRQQVRESEEQFQPPDAQVAECSAILERAKEGTSYTNIDEVAADIRELERTARSIEIELAGARASLDAIEKYRARPDLKAAETRSALDRLLIEHDIQMAGVMARKQVVEQHLFRAKTCHEAMAKHAAAVENRGRIASRLERQRASAAQQESFLTNPSGGAAPIPLVDNKVVIRKISYKE